MIVSNTGSWEVAIENLVRKDTRASMSIFSKLGRFGRLTCSMKLRIIDVKVLPILLYACEIWGAYDISTVERALTNFYRYLLRLRRNSPTPLACGELGRHSIKTWIWPRMIDFWVDTVHASNDSARHAAYNVQLRALNSGAKCWATAIRRILQETGFGDVWANQFVSYPNAFKYEFKQRCKDMDSQEWQHKVSTFGSLRTYRLIKTSLEYEKYLDFPLSQNYLNLFTRIRGGLTEIRMNTGRWGWEGNLPAERRFCTFCNLEQVEDEFHVIFVCPAWSTFRMELYPEVQSNNMRTILSASEPVITRKICLYIEKVLDLREEITVH